MHLLPIDQGVTGLICGDSSKSPATSAALLIPNFCYSRLASKIGLFCAPVDIIWYFCAKRYNEYGSIFPNTCGGGGVIQACNHIASILLGHFIDSCEQLLIEKIIHVISFLIMHLRYLN